MADKVDRLSLYQKHLNRVSRSFALSISHLDHPLRKWISLTYLVCRILDTVEDARWRRLSDQIQKFEEFDGIIAGKISKTQLADWDKNFPQDIPQGEKELLRDSEVIFKDFESLPEKLKEKVFNLILSMSAGMRYFSSQKSQGALKLSGLREVNQYCFFVAGVVGETLVNFLQAVDSELKLSPSLLVKAHHFGLFLQKVNLLKDQAKDEKEGRFLIPSRKDVLTSLEANLSGAYQYCLAVPPKHKSYRVFCLWSLFLGLSTLPLLRQGLDGEELAEIELKIPRDKAMELFNEIQNHAHDDEWIKDQFISLTRLAGYELDLSGLGEPEPSEYAKLSGWFRSAYKGVLSEKDLAHLGV